jgi:hypothetical protein
MFVQTIDDEDISVPPPAKKLKKSQCTPLFMCAYKMRGNSDVCLQSNEKSVYPTVYVCLQDERWFWSLQSKEKIELYLTCLQNDFCLLAHLSWKLKWAILIAGCPSVRPSVNFYIFDFFSRTTGPIFTRLNTDHLWGEGFQVYSNEGDCPSPRGDNSESVKIHWKFFKIFFFKTSRPNTIKLGTNYPWMKGIQFSLIKGPGPLQRGDNCTNVNMGWGHLKTLFSRTLSRLGTNHPWG